MDKRNEIIRAAMGLVAEHGFHGAPMAMIAKRAGAAAGTIYCYFESKDDLIRETHAFLEQQILAVLTENYPAVQPVRDRFLHVGCKLIKYFISSPLEFRFMEQFFISPYGAAHRREMLFNQKGKNIVIMLFEEALDQRLVKELSLPILFALAFGPLVDICRDHNLEFVFLDESLIDKVVAACWDALKR